jgi:hypothetical protein
MVQYLDRPLRIRVMVYDSLSRGELSKLLPTRKQPTEQEGNKKAVAV